ncbi:MAG: hypothetical protein ACYDEV_04885 [Acidiferrobacter sp.]
MKKTTLRIGGILLGLYLAWAVALGYYSTHRVIWNAQSRDFLDIAVVPTLNDPSLSAFRTLASARWQKTLDHDGKPLVKTLVALGPLYAFHVHGSSGLAWLHNFTIAAHYRIHAQFQQGAAVFRIALKKRHASWKITQLTVVRKTSLS